VGSNPVTWLGSPVFPKAARAALADTQLRRNLRKATHTIRDKRARAVAELPDWEQLRLAGEAVKDDVLSNLDTHLERMEAAVTARGGVVHWARDAREANEIVLRLAREAGADEVVKVKSMATAEIELNEALEAGGIRAVETDLAELIVQMGHDRPSHILVPAIHRNRSEIKEIFQREMAEKPASDDPRDLAEAARRHLRRKFLSARVAVSGANFGVADTGSIAVVESEGNGRMCLTLPEVLITVMGIEKLVPTWRDLEVFLQLLPRSSTAERMNPYTSVWTGVTPGDGPQQFHLFGPRVVNEFRAGYNRANSSSQALRASEELAFAAQNGFQSGPIIGFPNVNWTASGFTQSTNIFSAFTGATSNFAFENAFQYSDNVTVIHGNHTVKTGVDVRRFRFDRLQAFPPVGNYFFGPTYTANPSVSQATGHPYADFLLGLPTSVINSSAIDWSRQRDLYVGPYVQDDWKISRRLTLNIGFRYDLYTQPVDAKNTGGMFDPNGVNSAGRRGIIIVPGTKGYSRAIVQGHHKNFAPRFGFAYQATQKLVVRGGWGMFYSNREQNDQTTDMALSLLNFRNIDMPAVSAQTASALSSASPFAVVK